MGEWVCRVHEHGDLGEEEILQWKILKKESRNNTRFWRRSSSMEDFEESRNNTSELEVLQWKDFEEREQE